MSKKSIYEKPTEGVVLENGKVKEKFSFDDVEERTIDVKKTKKKQSKKKEESLEDYMQAQKELQEAFENLFLPEALEDQDTCVESLKTINDVLKQHKVDKEAIKNAFNGILVSKEYEKENPRVQLTKIKKIIGDTPNIDTEAAIDNILEEVMALVPEGMSYFEFMKEYKLVAKPRVSFFARLFKKNK
jgi:hypothetical protein